MEPTAEELETIARRVRRGALRSDTPERTWSGMGNGRRCDGCPQRIEKVDLQIEADFDGGRTTLRFHQPCFKAWLRASDQQRLTEI